MGGAPGASSAARAPGPRSCRSRPLRGAPTLATVVGPVNVTSIHAPVPSPREIHVDPSTTPLLMAYADRQGCEPMLSYSLEQLADSMPTRFGGGAGGGGDEGGTIPTKTLSSAKSDAMVLI